MSFQTIIEIEKFIQFKLNKRIGNLKEKRLLKGTFRIKGSNEILEGDNFMAYEIVGGDPLETYQCYIDYFNYTLKPHEREREVVMARWGTPKEDAIKHALSNNFGKVNVDKDIYFLKEGEIEEIYTGE